MKRARSPGYNRDRRSARGTVLPIIKVCGIRNEAEALGAISSGANTIGLLLGLTHLSEDEVTVDAAMRIVESLPAGVRTVMVTHLLDVDRIEAMAAEAGVNAIQIHGEMPLEGFEEARRRFPRVELIKAVHVSGREALQTARDYAPFADYLLLDSRTADRLGGTGLTHDWNISREIAAAVDVPVILAGGLNPENVARAIETVRPAGIDANSGLERPDGGKDFDKIRRFAEAGLACSYPVR